MIFRESKKNREFDGGLKNTVLHQLTNESIKKGLKLG
jgi:hypothetical protein